MTDATGRDTFTIMIAGEAGQGLATLGELITKCLARSGYRIVVTQSYHSRIRGGHNTFSIRASLDSICAPRESVDLLIALNDDAVELHAAQLTPAAIVIADETVTSQCPGMIKAPFVKLGSRRTANVVALGIAAAILELDMDLVAAAVHKQFGKKDEAVVQANEDALRNGHQWARDNAANGERALPEAIIPNPARLCLNGNQAIALGALSAGLKFAAFYPMTPSTSIILNIIANADAMGVVFEQAEDEIAAINMAIGASYAGAPAMVATSGGGLALMCEGISLSGATETPVVIAMAQRPGPATGLPTRTEQGDLEMVLHAGHGEFPRAIFAPGDIEECFHATRQAFTIAEASQSPAFILTDQFLADSFRAVEPFDPMLPSIHVPTDAEPVALPYQRYALTDSGISPRLIPAASEHLVAVDSDEHTPDGRITEDHGVRIAQMDKRLRKLSAIAAEVLEPTYFGDGSPKTLLVCWGSTKGAVHETVEDMRSRGDSAAMLHFQQVWPLVPDAFIATLRAAEKCVVVEGNATGQFARLLRRETGFNAHAQVLRYDGLPITPEYIHAALANA